MASPQKDKERRSIKTEGAFGCVPRHDGKAVSAEKRQCLVAQWGGIALTHGIRSMLWLVALVGAALRKGRCTLQSSLRKSQSADWKVLERTGGFAPRKSLTFHVWPTVLETV